MEGSCNYEYFGSLSSCGFSMGSNQYCAGRIYDLSSKGSMNRPKLNVLLLFYNLSLIPKIEIIYNLGSKTILYLMCNRIYGFVEV